MGLFQRKEKKVTFSPEFVRAQSRQNLSEMSRIVDRLYNRANTPAEREALCAMTNALSDIKPGTGMVPAVLDVEELLQQVLLDYNSSLDENTAEGIDTSTIEIINKIVGTRKKMYGCNMDADHKRGLKTYLKANKGMGNKKELKLMYEKKYASSMAEVNRYVGQSKTLEQLVKSYQLRLREAQKNAEIEELDGVIQKLAAKYKKSTDQAERDRMNTEYQTLLRKKKALDADLQGIKNALGHVATVEALLGQLTTQSDIENIDNMDIKEFEDLAGKVTDGLKRAQKRNVAFDDAYGAVARATDAALRRSADALRGGETLDSVILKEQAASLDDITDGVSTAHSEAATLDDLIDIDD